MEQIKILILGIILGVVTYYWLDEDRVITIPCPQVDCEKKEDIISSTREILYDTQIVKEIKREEDKSVKNEEKKIIEKLKTPDELYEEQERLVEESMAESIPFEEDRDVVSIEQELAEQEVANSNLEEDRSLVSLELEQMEASSHLNVMSDEELNSEENLPPLTPESTSEIEEIQEVVSDEMRDVEENGEEEYFSDEDDIPQ